jgi:hypothetical protein
MKNKVEKIEKKGKKSDPALHRMESLCTDARAI